MAGTFNKFNCTSADIAHGVHNLGSDELKVLLTNTEPNAADTHVDTVETPCVVEGSSNAVEIAAGNDYTKGGKVITRTSSSQTAGLYRLIMQDVEFAADGGAWPTFQYAVVYNNTAGAAATRPVLGWWKRAASVTLQDTETVTIDFDQSAGMLQFDIASA